MEYREAIDWLFGTQMFGIKLGLEGPARLLREFLAFPEHGVRVIHVAGTNGKGSTCAMMDRVARSSGLRTGLFTSPHLIDYRERIQVSGVMIPESEVARGLTELREICERLDPHPTFFEITLALGMRWFRLQGCELIILETGMGGRLDATTAVPADVCVITPIGMDHTQWLGETLGAIAGEKAGILVEGKPAVSGPQADEARVVLEREANVRRAPLDFIEEPLRGYPIGLCGEHQALNAALALAALHRAGVSLRYETVADGLSKVEWPGRFERFEGVKGAAGPVILDGAHNPHAARVLLKTWREEFGDRKAALVFSAVCSKDIAGILEFLSEIAGSIHLCPVDTVRSVSTEELAGFLPEGAVKPTLHGGFEEAFEEALLTGLPVLVAGSLYLVGEARARLTGGDFQSCSQ